MTKQEVILTIGPDGQMKLEIAGVCGPGCQDIAAPIERALGVAMAEVPTDEFYLDAVQSQEVAQ